MRSSSRNLAAVALAVALAIVLAAAGCRTVAPEDRRPSVRMDACAERLHDACGQLLLYYSLHQRLPETLDALATLGAPAPLPLVCPVSGKPYVYRPEGLAVPAQPGRLVLYDADPSHSGMRWGVLVGGAEEGKRLTTRVVLLPDNAVSAAP